MPRHRYSRHERIAEIGVAGQTRIGNSRVLVVGAGGLGSPVLLYLAAAGVGTIGIVDSDRVDLSNLQRQIIHTEARVGERKTLSAHVQLAALNSDVDLQIFDTLIDASNAAEIIDNFDLVIDGSDNFPTRYLLNDACVLAGKPYVWGSILRFDGQLSVFGVPGGPCYRCVFPEPPEPGSVPSCADAGVLGAICGVVGSLQATEALKIITGVGDIASGRLLIYDALSARISELPVQRNPHCPTCGENPTVTELVDYAAWCAGSEQSEVIDLDNLVDLLEKRAAGAVDFALVDIREDHEVAHGMIPGAAHIALSRFPAKAADAGLEGQRVILYCQTGVRSAQLLRLLSEQPPERGWGSVQHYLGGFGQWSSRR